MPCPTPQASPLAATGEQTWDCKYQQWQLDEEKPCLLDYWPTCLIHAVLDEELLAPLGTSMGGGGLAGRGCKPMEQNVTFPSLQPFPTPVQPHRG